MLSVERARALLDRARQARVLVAGDLMLDEFVWGKVSRISPEAPVPVVEVTGESAYAGGAANVARNVRELGAAVSVTGLVGNDEAGRELARLLDGSGIDSSPIVVDPNLPTIVKTRVVALHQQVVRIDREARLVLNQSRRHALTDQLRARMGDWDALILSDYAKGLLSAEFVAELCASARGRLIAVDPSPRNPLNWNGVTVVKPNLKEARAAARLGDDAMPDQAATALFGLWDTAMLLVTLGEHGMLLARPGEPSYHTPTRAREVYDVSGAGDTAIAVFTLALGAGARPEEAAELANHASGVVVGKLGTATVQAAELLESVARTAA
jgi:D-beta-D-heptose 7-phosphate kinase/D-beta-D-heptose 1-phosphate adenosyltransferase